MTMEIYSVHCSFSLSFLRSNNKFLILSLPRYYLWYTARVYFTLCGFITIVESRSLLDYANSLIPQFPHSQQVFSFALVHGKRAPSVVVPRQVLPRKVFLAIEVCLLFLKDFLRIIIFKGFSSITTWQLPTAARQAWGLFGPSFLALSSWSLRCTPSLRFTKRIKIMYSSQVSEKFAIH